MALNLRAHIQNFMRLSLTTFVRACMCICVSVNLHVYVMRLHFLKEEVQPSLKPRLIHVSLIYSFLKVTNNNSYELKPCKHTGPPSFK